MFALTIEDDNGQVAEKFSFDHGSYVVGRKENCDIVLPSSSVSRTHAKLFVDDGRCFVEDLDSANGVTVDGQKVAGTRELGSAAQIRVGDYFMYVEYQGGETPNAGDGRQTLYISEGDDHNKLVRINDEFAGEEFTLSEVKNTIGRTDENFILLSDPSISREHAVISRDGTRYVLSDRGSSNGTRVNGEEVVGPYELEPRDVVEFGNVEFVFARGDADIDPNEFSGSEMGFNTLIAGIIAVTAVLSAVAVGLLVVYGISRSGASTERTDGGNQTADRTARLLEQGRNHLENEQWSRAKETFNQILNRSPNHDKAKRLRQRARQGRRDQERLDKALDHSKEERYEKALDELDDIPKESPVYEKAKPTLQHVRKSIAYKLQRNSAEPDELSGEAEFQRAHEKLSRAKRLAPSDSDIESTIEKSVRELEAEMKEHGVAPD